MQPLPPALALAALILIAACDGSQGWPDLPVTTEARADGAFPALVPLGPLLEGASALPSTPPTADLPARLNRLAQRAQGLRGPVLAPPDRARIEARARDLRRR